jgi:hypothetical protein
MIDVELIQVEGGPTQFARWSPDGVGYYYFDSLREALKAHPEGEGARRIYLTETWDEYDRRTERH